VISSPLILSNFDWLSVVANVILHVLLCIVACLVVFLLSVLFW
jgi:hypothetical protein